MFIRAGGFMLILILSVLGLFIVQTLLPPIFRFFSKPSDLRQNLGIALTGRDNQPDMPTMGGRAERACDNMKEALPVFLTLAIVHMVLGTSAGWATTGALVFLGARVLYVPAYLSGVFGVRTLTWVVSWAGMGLMIAAFWLPNS